MTMKSIEPGDYLIWIDSPWTEIKTGDIVVVKRVFDEYVNITYNNWNFFKSLFKKATIEDVVIARLKGNTIHE